MCFALSFPKAETLSYNERIIVFKDNCNVPKD